MADYLDVSESIVDALQDNRIADSSLWVTMSACVDDIVSIEFPSKQELESLLLLADKIFNNELMLFYIQFVFAESNFERYYKQLVDYKGSNIIILTTNMVYFAMVKKCNASQLCFKRIVSHITEYHENHGNGSVLIQRVLHVLSYIHMVCEDLDAINTADLVTTTMQFIADLSNKGRLYRDATVAHTRSLVILALTKNSGAHTCQFTPLFLRKATQMREGGTLVHQSIVQVLREMVAIIDSKIAKTDSEGLSVLLLCNKLAEIVGYFSAVSILDEAIIRFEAVTKTRLSAIMSIIGWVADFHVDEACIKLVRDVVTHACMTDPSSQVRARILIIIGSKWPLLLVDKEIIRVLLLKTRDVAATCRQEAFRSLANFGAPIIGEILSSNELLKASSYLFKVTTLLNIEDGSSGEEFLRQIVLSTIARVEESLSASIKAARPSEQNLSQISSTQSAIEPSNPNQSHFTDAVCKEMTIGVEDRSIKRAEMRSSALRKVTDGIDPTNLSASALYIFLAAIQSLPPYD